MNSPFPSYGASRDRAASVSFAEVETAARELMAAGDYPSVAAVREILKGGSTTTISNAMRRFWKNQSALNAGNPVALTRLPPEFADAAVALWEQALRLSVQTAKSTDTAAQANLEELQRATDTRERSLELREKEWDMAARVNERALAETREQVNVLLRELARSNTELRSHKTKIASLLEQIDGYRTNLARVIARAVERSRNIKLKLSATKVRKPTSKVKRTSRVTSKQRSRRSKKK